MNNSQDKPQNAVIKSHKQWRKEVKKLRRKKIRQKQAKERDDLLKIEEQAQRKDPKYLSWLLEQRHLELLQEEEEERVRAEGLKKWLVAEEQSQKKHLAYLQRLEEIEQANQLQKQRIREEFEAAEKKIEEIKEQTRKREAEKLKNYNLLLHKIESYINCNGELPEELTVPANSNPNKPNCPFFEKTSTCKFGARCTNNHCRPGISNILLIQNMFTHILLDQTNRTEYGNDLSIEFDELDLYKCFVEFFEDTTVEFEKFGRIHHFWVCSNEQPHLRGNVYIEYEQQRDALKSLRQMQGRYYSGKQINIEFCTIPTWSTALCDICGLSIMKKCQKGRACNFLHVFENPHNKYPLRANGRRTIRNGDWRARLSRHIESGSLTWSDDEDADKGKAEHTKLKKNHWRWSESPETEVVEMRIQNSEATGQNSSKTDNVVDQISNHSSRKDAKHHSKRKMRRSTSRSSRKHSKRKKRSRSRSKKSKKSSKDKS